jgi:hypothetical protein
MQKVIYELKGLLTYNEQLILLTGHLSMDEKGTAEGYIIEIPSSKTYLIEGSLSAIAEEKCAALDLIESPMNIDVPTISYFLTKSYAHIKEDTISIEGTYQGIRREDVITSTLLDESKPLEKRIDEMIKNLRTSDDTKSRQVTLSLEYQQIVRED